MGNRYDGERNFKVNYSGEATEDKFWSI